MAPGKRQVKARRHLVCNHCHSLVDFAISGCGKTWSETTEEGFTFQCLGCWKVDCLTAELARLTDIVKGMQSGGRVIARTTNGERTTGNMTCRKETGEKVTVEKEGGTRGQEMREVDATGGKTNGRKEVRGDVIKRKSITRTMTGGKETGKKGTTEKAAGGKVSNQGDAKRRSYSEAVIEGALRTERVFMGDSILRKTDRTKNSLESPTEFGYKCVCLNARSIVNKRNELNIMVEDIDPHIIGITESWATLDISDAELGMKGYVMFRKDRLGRRGGGVILYIKKSIQAYEIKLEKEAECEEAVWCNIITGKSTLTVGLVYRSPNISMEENEKIHNAIKEVSKRDCIIMGDFNHGHIQWTSLQSTGREDQEFFNLVQDSFLSQLVLEATRGENVLYIVLSSQKEFVDNVKICEPLGCSDHNQIHFIIKVKGERNRKIRYRK